MKIKEAEHFTTRVEMLPLIDIVFLLLVFFIYAMLSMAVHRGVEVRLPVSSTATVEKESLLSVTIRPADGAPEIYVDDEAVRREELVEHLQRRGGEIAARTGGEPGVLLFVDRDVSYQQVFSVLDLLAEAGLSRISLQADAVPQ
ncbi:MAG: hypothetical protein Kow0089_22430 [Desulfobulbaceae bacterium]